jgi:hypothetical protein
MCLPWLSVVRERVYEKSKSLVIRIIKNDLGMACRLDGHPWAVFTDWLRIAETRSSSSWTTRSPPTGISRGRGKTLGACPVDRGAWVISDEADDRSLRGFVMESRHSVSSRSRRCRARSTPSFKRTQSSPALFRRVCDGGSTPVRWSRFLRCHYVRVGVVLGGPVSSEETQNSVECVLRVWYSTLILFQLPQLIRLATSLSRLQIGQQNPSRPPKV